MGDAHYATWLWQAPAGLVLVGFGLSLFGHATIKKAASRPAREWVLWGTLSLVVINGGLCLFGDAVKHRVFYELSTRGGR